MRNTATISKTKKNKMPPAKVIGVINKIRGNVGKFHQKMVPPQIAMFEMVTSMWNAQAISVAARLGVADVLKDSEMHFEDIATKVHAHPLSLYRLLRGLTNTNVFAEVREGVFRCTPYGRCLREDVPETVKSMAIFQGQYQWAHWAEMLHSVKTGETTPEKVRGKGLFEFMGQNPDAQKHFDEFMTTVSKMETDAVLSAYDFSQFQVIADVAGGHGALLAAILESAPKAKGILFDQPQVVAKAEEALTTGHLKNRCEIVSGDFFKSVPAGADAYVMKHIIHDWEESLCLKILGHIRNQIKPGGKLILIETIITPPGIPHFSKLLDLEMLVNAGGAERTEKQYAELFEKAGFKLNRVIATASLASIIEASPR